MASRCTRKLRPKQRTRAALKASQQRTAARVKIPENVVFVDDELAIAIAIAVAVVQSQCRHRKVRNRESADKKIHAGDARHDFSGPWTWTITWGPGTSVKSMNCRLDYGAARVRPRRDTTFFLLSRLDSVSLSPRQPGAENLSNFCRDYARRQNAHELDAQVLP